jgi:hypothetical protein
MIWTRKRVARSALLVSTAFGLALALGACSSATPAPTATSSAGSRANTHRLSAQGAINSCTVVTQANVSAALGESVQPGVRGKATVEGGVACVFYGPAVPAGTNPDVPTADSVRVVLVKSPNGTQWFNDYKGKVHAVEISGLGDQAYYDGTASVSVLKGTEYLRIAVVKSSGPDESAEEALAKTALPLM